MGYAGGGIPIYQNGRLWYVADRTTGQPIRPPETAMTSDAWQDWIVEEAHRCADQVTGVAQCYFIGGDSGPVKIGYSVDPLSRLAALQSASPVRLQILAVRAGGEARETAYHQQFADARLHGEWFERTPLIAAEIERLRSL